MSQPSVVQTLKYRRSWLGWLILLALVVQWSVLWYRSADTYDRLNWDVPVCKFELGSAQAFAYVGVSVPLSRQPFSEFHFYSSYPTVMPSRAEGRTSYAVEIEQTIGRQDREGNFLGKLQNYPARNGFGSASFVFVSYLFLLLYTLLAYFAIGQIRRWRFDRWVKRTGAQKGRP